MASFFEVQLLVLAVFCGLALLFERFVLKRDDDETSHKDALDDAASSTGSLVKAADRLGLSYLGVYAVVMGMWFPQVVPRFLHCPPHKTDAIFLRFARIPYAEL